MCTLVDFAQGGDQVREGIALARQGPPHELLAAFDHLLKHEGEVAVLHLVSAIGRAQHWRESDAVKAVLDERIEGRAKVQVAWCHRDARRDLHLALRRKQRGDIGQMIWNVPEIIAQLSSQYELCPGDIILTGTPAGVGPLVPGDVVECSIERLGTFSIRIGPKLQARA